MAEIWWCKAGPNGQNFGDIITPYVYKKITGKECRFATNFNNPIYIGAGSIMGMCKGNVIVWGSGIMNRNERFNKPLEVLSVRGPITRKRFLELGYHCPEIYGDIGLILPRFYNPQLTKKYKLGVIPHYVDLAFCKKHYANDEDVNVIDLCAGIEKVVDELVQCEVTVSSSLHGIIASHAYGIKCGWVRFSEKIAGGFTKYHDYYGSVGIVEAITPKYIKDRVEPKALIEFVNSYQNPAFPINTDQIMEVCPWKEEKVAPDELTFNLIYEQNLLHHELREYLAGLLKSLGCRVHGNLQLNHPEFSLSEHIVIGRSNPPKGQEYTLLECNQPETSSSQHKTVIAKAKRVWYFSQSGLVDLLKINPNAIYIPFIYYPSEAPPIRSKDIDVCLLGHSAPRRNVVMKRLKEEGLNVYYSSTCWGRQKADILGRTKLVLNIHFYPKSHQELMRILEGLFSGCVVVSEESLDKNNDQIFSCDYVQMLPYNIEQIVAVVKDHLSRLPPSEEISNCSLLKQYKEGLESALRFELKNNYNLS